MLHFGLSGCELHAKVPEFWLFINDARVVKWKGAHALLDTCTYGRFLGIGVFSTSNRPMSCE